MAAAPMMIDLLSSSSDDNDGEVEIIASFNNTADDPIEIVESSSSSLGSVGAMPPSLPDTSVNQNNQPTAKTPSISIPITESRQSETPSESEVKTQTESTIPSEGIRPSEQIIERCERSPPLTPSNVVGHKRKIIRDSSQESVTRTSQESISTPSQAAISAPCQPTVSKTSEESMTKPSPSDGSPVHPAQQSKIEVIPKAAAGPRPKANAASPNAVSSFFCKAKASNVLSQIQEILADRHLSNPTRAPPAPVASVKPAAKSSPPVQVVTAIPEKRPPNANPAPSSGVQEISSKDDFMRSQIEKEQREREKMLEIQRLKQTYRITDTQPVVRPIQQSAQADSFLSSMDPALLAVFAASQASPTKDSPQTQPDPGKAVEEPMIARVYEVFSLDASRNMRQIKPLSLRIAQQNTFGQVKQAYCANRQKNPQGLVLTFNETPLFDSVTVGASGINPRLDEKGCKYVELVIYTREILASVKAEKKKQLESGLEFLDSPVSNVDVSDLMEDTGAAQGFADAATGSSMTLTIRFGKGESEVLPVTPDMTLQELLSAFQTRSPDLNLANARFKFDGSTLNLADTIADAELEDEDMLELIL